jgi:hypothetical protein
MKGLMIKIPVIAGIGSACSAELPVGEELLGEPGITCVSGDSTAVITTIWDGVKTVELYSGGRKAYIEFGEDGSVWANTGRVRYELSAGDVGETGEEVDAMLSGVMADIAFGE